MVAVGHTILIMIYHMLQQQKSYREPVLSPLDARRVDCIYSGQRKIDPAMRLAEMPQANSFYILFCCGRQRM